MERVAFLIEQTGRRIECLLNPNSVSITRQSGLRTRQSLGGAVTGLAASDDCVLATGGGVTQLQLELLFDLSKAGDNAPQDVRTLTAPLWNLAENGSAADNGGAPPQVRFVWGKSWNVPGIVAAVAERFERFTEAGIAQRSWVSLRFLRVSERSRPVTPRGLPAPSPDGAPLISGPDGGDLQVHQVTGEPGADGTPDIANTERPDQVAHHYAGNPADWRVVMDANPHVDPAGLVAGMLLVIPRFRGPA